MKFLVLFNALVAANTVFGARAQNSGRLSARDLKGNALNRRAEHRILMVSIAYDFSVLFFYKISCGWTDEY